MNNRPVINTIISRVDDVEFHDEEHEGTRAMFMAMRCGDTTICVDLGSDEHGTSARALDQMRDAVSRGVARHWGRRK